MPDALVSVALGFFLGAMNSFAFLQMFRFREHASWGDQTRANMRSLKWRQLLPILGSIYLVIAFWLYMELTDRIEIQTLWIVVGVTTGLSWVLLLFWIAKRGKVKADESRFEHYMKERFSSEPEE
jgi:Na+/melibiose symporter-like transporter